MTPTEITFRRDLSPKDLPLIRKILDSSGFFHDFEVDIAVSLAEENLEKGDTGSGYFFDLAEIRGKLAGYSCYGPTPCTLNSYDLYWIAVDAESRSAGLGKMLMNRMVDHLKTLNCQNLWIETSSRPLYEPTRQFYLRYGCEQIAILPRFYAEDDDKIIFRLKV